MDISIKFSDLELLSEEDKRRVFKLIYDASAQSKFGSEYDDVDFEWESGDNLERLVERARKHERITNKKKD